MPPSEARLYFVVTVKGDIGPFSKQELREQLREHAFAATDRVRNAFGRPLGSVSEVLGNASQTIQAPQPTAPATQRRAPSKTGPPWPIIAVAGGIIVVLLLLWLSSGGSRQPEETFQPAAPQPPTPTTPSIASPAPAPAPAPAPVRNQPPPPAAASNGLPAGFSLLDLGDARPKSTADANGRGLIVISGGGADIWGNRDECAFLHRPLRTDSTLTVEVRSMDDTDAWDKAGLMIRGSTAPDVMHASIVVVHTGLVQFLSRYGNGHETTGSELRLPSFPIWIRLERRGNSYAGSASADGRLWQQVGAVELAATPNPAAAGLVVSSHNRSVLNRTTFAGLTVSETR